MAEARGVKFCKQQDYIKYWQRDNKSSPKGTWLGSRDPCAPWHTIKWGSQCH